MNLPGAFIIFCKELVQRALEIEVNCQGVSTICVSFSWHTPELSRHMLQFVFEFSFPSVPWFYRFILNYF